MATNTDQTIIMKIAKFILILLCAAVTPVLKGSELSPTPAPLQKITWAIGAEIYNFKYEESIMDEEGIFYGFNLDFTMRPWAADLQADSPPDGGPMFGIEGRAAFGQVDYDGELDDGTPLTVNNIDDYVLEVRGLIGMDRLAGEAIHNLYVGLGYRYLNDGLAVHPAGYERESNDLYIFQWQSLAGVGSQYVGPWWVDSPWLVRRPALGLPPLRNAGIRYFDGDYEGAVPANLASGLRGRDPHSDRGRRFEPIIHPRSPSWAMKDC